MEASPFHHSLYSAICYTSIITAEHDFCPSLMGSLGFCLAEAPQLLPGCRPATPHHPACHGYLLATSWCLSCEVSALWTAGVLNKVRKLQKHGPSFLEVEESWRWSVHCVPDTC